ncbi:MAG: hypothetical protein P8184_01015 [Calditrichia bacterium]
MLRFNITRLLDQKTLMGLVFIALISVIACSKQEPPDAIIKMAKERTLAIIDSVQINEGTVESKPQLVEEYFDKDSSRYVLKYSVETVFGSALTDTPTIYIERRNNQWHYIFKYDRYHDEILSTH